MTLEGKWGWINPYALPDEITYKNRLLDTDGMILRYGYPRYEQLALEMGRPWLAEVYPYEANPDYFAELLAKQAKQPGCVGAVANFEYGSERAVAHWDRDDGSLTHRFCNVFEQHAPGVPLYACIDTRRYHVTQPFARALALRAHGVMPMMYPKQFGQSPSSALAAVMAADFQALWRGKETIIVIQTFEDIGPALVRDQLDVISKFTQHQAVSAYTLGHAKKPEWQAFASHPAFEDAMPDKPAYEALAVSEALLKLRVQWYEGITKLALDGNPGELAAFAAHWQQLEAGGR